MRHDPRRLEVIYGPLRRQLHAAGLAVAYPHELPPCHADDVLRVARTQEHLATAPILTVAHVEKTWFLILHEWPARYLEVDASRVADVVVALVSSAREMAAPVSISTRSGRLRWLLDESPLASLPVGAVTYALFVERRRRARQRIHEAKGWQALTDEAFVRSQLERFDNTFRSSASFRLPDPSRVWATSAHARLPVEEQEQQESDLTLAVLRALRAVVRPGEHVLVLDWISTCWRLDPHGPIGDAHHESWPRRFLDDETIYWVDPAFRFGLVTDWRSLRFRAFGTPLLEALEPSRPAVLQPLAPDAPSDAELDALLRAQDESP